MQDIPVSTGEPVRLHVSKDYIPKNHTKPADVSLHLSKAVRLELERDLRIGVLRKVPVNTPSYKGLHILVVVPKKDGKVRRTVDFKHLNNLIPHQAHHTNPPFSAVSRIPSRGT